MDDQLPEPAAAPEEAKPAPRPSRFVRREKAAADALRAYLRDLFEDRFGAVPPVLPEVELALRLKVRPGEDWRLGFEPSLAEQAGAQLAESQAGRNVYRAGRVYCFRCESSDCEHAEPPSSLSVFAGYAPNGWPEWQELVQAFLASGDERVDQLYEPRSGALALFQPGHALKGRQLSSFGRSSRTYAILAQVVAGFFPWPAEGRGSPVHPARLAITFQAVEGRNAEGGLSLRLNLLAARPGGESIADRLASGWQPALYRAWKTAEMELEGVEKRARAAQVERNSDYLRRALQAVPGLLRRLAESIERGGRQEHRRTRHVEQRRQEQRPVHKALEDVREAAPDRFFLDQKAGTAVVLGSRGRAHVFNRTGRHVTSFNLRPPEVDTRLRSERWKIMSPDEAASFRQLIEDYLPDQKDKGPPASV